LSPEEIEVFMQLGAPIQVADDLGDIREDQEEGHESLATIGEIVPEEVWGLYEEAFLKLQNLIAEKDYDQNGFLRFRGMVAYYIEKNLKIFDSLN
jgi:hypothetical protein